MKPYDFIKEELDGLKAAGLFRKARTISEINDVRCEVDGHTLINFCSNNYLGYADDPRVVEGTVRLIEKFGVGSGASRLVSGNFDVHEELERKIAQLEGTEASIVFPTGYMANIGTIQALVGAGDAVIIDRLDHASIIDGARLSGAKMLVYKHNDMADLEKLLIKAAIHDKKLIVSDHVFSMDGDIAPLQKLDGLARRHDAMLMVDTAHSTGVLDIDIRDRSHLIIMGTLSKAIGSLGGFVAGTHELVDYLRNRARAYMYTTALPPAMAAASLASIELIIKGDKARKKLWDNIKYLKGKLGSLGFNMLDSETQIIPIIIGDSKLAKEISDYLFNKGIFLTAIRPPTVPKGTSRLRLTVTAMHTKEDIDHLISALAEVREKFLV